MATKKRRKMHEDEVLALLASYINKAVGYQDSDLASERAEVTEYYNGDKPRQSHKGNSKYVSLDVYDSIEALKDSVLDVFSGTTEIVKFSPQGKEDVQQARIGTEYASYVVHRQNDSACIFHDVLHDGLTGRNGIVKYWWEHSEERTEEAFEELSVDELDFMLAQDPDLVLDTLEEDEDGLYSGTLVRTEDKSQVRIEVIPPEEFLISPRARSIEASPFVGHRTKKTISDLRKEGYPEAKISDIGSDADAFELETEEEVLARFDQIGASSPADEYDQDGESSVRTVMVYECYIQADLDGDGLSKLWKITRAGNVLLDKEPVSEKPFLSFVPLPIPHSFWGSNYAKYVINTQNAKTVLTRGILDHTVITNNPRYQVVKGGLPNPRELMDNRTGGIVNVNRPDAVAPLIQASLNPFVFQTIQLLDQDLEDTTGVSRLSQGLNHDAVSKQNSRGLVNDLVTLSQIRQKQVAAQFGKFVKELYLRVFNLVVEREDRSRIVELAGDWAEVNPTTWNSRKDAELVLTLGYGEKEKETQKWISLDQLLTQDPKAQRLYTEQHKHAVLVKVMGLMGVKDHANYLADPQKLGPPQPDPAAMMQLEMQKRQLDLAERQQALAEAKFKAEMQIKGINVQLDQKKAEADFALRSDEVDLKERQQDHKEFVDKAELEIAKNADDVRAIASPTG
jgi:hypothetical protein